MLLSEGPAPRREEEGVRVAGLIDLAEMFARGLIRTLDPADAKVAARKMNTRADLWEEHRVFADPLGHLRYDTGTTFDGKPLRAEPSMRDLAENGQSVREYLDGTQMGDWLAQDPIAAREMDATRIGMTPLPTGYGAGYNPPTFARVGDGYRTLQPGMLMINSNSDPAKHKGYFEHELQHMLQNIFGQSPGTNVDDVAGPKMDFMIEQGLIDPQRISALDEFNNENFTSKGYGRYLHAFGEAEARAAERRSQHPALEQMSPVASQYSWTDDNTPVNRGLLFELPRVNEEEFSRWWRNKWAKGGS